MTHCTECDKPLRFGNTRAAEAPGTVRGYSTTGLCVTCSRHGLSAKKSASACLRTCTKCRRRMRPDKTRKVDWPNTVAPVNKTTCISCHEKARRGLPAWELEARKLEVLPLTREQRAAATRVVIARAAGDTMILEALGLSDTHCEVS